MDREEPHMMDLRVGAMIRRRRKELNKSQQDLARAIDVTFQQVQKYERGANRVSASKLYEISRFLEISVSYFFGEPFMASAAGSTDAEADLSIFLTTDDGLELVKYFPKLTPALRKRTVALIKTIVTE